MDDFDLEIKKEFIGEALMNLDEVEGSFMELESTSDKVPLLEKIFRVAHNLKGGARAVGFGDVAEFTHNLENLVSKIQKNTIPMSSNLVTVLLRSNDRLVEMLSELKNNMEATFDNSDLLTEIQKWLDGGGDTAAALVVVESTENLNTKEADLHTPDISSTLESAPDLDLSIEPLVEEKIPETVPDSNEFFASEVAVVPEQSKPNISSTGNDKQIKEDEIIRVSLSRIDLLNDYVGELIVLQSVIQQQVLQNTPAKLQVSLRQMVKLSKDVQSLSMSLRMLPVRPLVQKLQRVVRDTAKTLGKSVQFEVVGDHLDIDKSVLDRLADPLIHILRNAVDHGLESEDTRKNTGKNPTGKLSLHFANEGNHLVVEVTDDGKGIDGEVLKRKAIEKKLITATQNLTEKQLVHLIFHPGFSTKSEASEISGRGVGMDVVKTNVEKIGGNVDVTTQVGAGSNFRIQIPLSLAVIEGLIVTSETNRYVIPLNQVQETVNLSSQKIYPAKLGIGSCFELRGIVVPIFNIEDTLGLKTQAAVTAGSTALIINVGDQLMALAVKDIVRAQQIVIKPLGNGISPQKGWVGSCVLGDGSPALIVNPVDLLAGKISQKFLDQDTGGSL